MYNNHQWFFLLQTFSRNLDILHYLLKVPHLPFFLQILSFLVQVHQFLAQVLQFPNQFQTRSNQGLQVLRLKGQSQNQSSLLFCCEEVYILAFLLRLNGLILYKALFLSPIPYKLKFCRDLQLLDYLYPKHQ